MPGRGSQPENTRDLWAQFPADLVDAFGPHVPMMTEYVLREIQRAVPEYSTRHSRMERDITTGVEQAITRCLAAARGKNLGTGPINDWRSVFVWLGRAEFRHGRSLDCLQAAYRAGGRAVWRYLSEFCRAHAVPSDLVYVLADAVFATVDDMSALSLEGHAEARAAAAGAVEHHRARLLSLLISDSPPTPAAIGSLAAAAGWPVPTHVRVVALTPPEDGAGTGFALDSDVLRDLRGPRPCLVTGSAETHLARLEARLSGRSAAIGPRVRITEAAGSFACARRALTLAAGGVLPAQRVLHCDQHLMSMWLTTDPFLTARLGEQVLAPFGALTVRQRQRFADTLLAWLRCNGRIMDVAEALQVHPQTVRYRLNQLGEMFGERLDDPESRLAMEMVLRSSRLLGLTAASSDY